MSDDETKAEVEINVLSEEDEVEILAERASKLAEQASSLALLQDEDMGNDMSDVVTVQVDTAEKLKSANVGEGGKEEQKEAAELANNEAKQSKELENLMKEEEKGAAKEKKKKKTSIVASSLSAVDEESVVFTKAKKPKKKEKTGKSKKKPSPEDVELVLITQEQKAEEAEDSKKDFNELQEETWDEDEDPDLSKYLNVSSWARCTRCCRSSGLKQDTSIRPRNHGFGLIFTIVALFSVDFNVAFLPKSLDPVTDWVLFSVLVFFTLEFALTWATKQYYFNSFYFWLDLISAASLLTDISFILNLGELSDETRDLQNQGQGTSAAADLGSISSTARTFKLAKFARILRLIRLIRITKLLKQMRRDDQKKLADTKAQPSKIGLHLADLIIKRVVIMLFAVMLLVPSLDTTQGDSGTQRVYAFSQLATLSDYAQKDASASTLLEQSTLEFRSFYSEDLLYLEVAGSVLDSDTEYIAKLRSNEYVSYRLGNNSSVVFSNRGQAFTEACFSLILTVVIACIFMLGSLSISSASHTLVVQPIERMTEITRKMAAQLFLASASSNDEQEMTAGMEVDMIESVIERMAGVFKVGGQKGKAQQNEQLLTRLALGSGGKDEHLVDARALKELEQLQRDTKQSVKNIVADHKELKSIRTILEDPMATAYFRQFLISTFSGENLTFYQEVDKFKSSVLSLASHIHAHFIKENAPSQINLHEQVKIKITESMDNPSTSVFNKAQETARKLMQSNSYTSFMLSKVCVAYINHRAKQDAEEEAEAKAKAKQQRSSIVSRKSSSKKLVKTPESDK